MAAWFQNERFWKVFVPYMFNAERMELGKDQARQAAELAGIASGAVLDLCCGPGRISLPLCEMGFAVTGVDASPFLLDMAKQRAAEQGITAEFLLMDMREFVRPQAFELALNLFTSFGYFEDPADDQRVLANLRESLKPGGVLVMELMSKEVLARIHKPAMVEVHADGAMLVQQVFIEKSWTRVRSVWTLVRGERAETFELEHALYSGRELKDLLLAAGFASVDVLGGLDGCEYGPKAERLVLVARCAA